MPKDEFDFEDPLELQGVGIFTEEDTSEVMAECFIEEFMRMGFDHYRIFGLFRNPYYIGMNMVLQNRGEDFIRKIIEETFAKWGHSITWNSTKEKARLLASLQNQSSFTCATSTKLQDVPLTESSEKSVESLLGDKSSLTRVTQVTSESKPVIDPMGNIVPDEILGDKNEQSL